MQAEIKKKQTPKICVFQPSTAFSKASASSLSPMLRKYLARQGDYTPEVPTGER